jgi:hypothetical protein
LNIEQGAQTTVLVFREEADEECVPIRNHDPSPDNRTGMFVTLCGQYCIRCKRRGPIQLEHPHPALGNPREFGAVLGDRVGELQAPRFQRISIGILVGAGNETRQTQWKKKVSNHGDSLEEQ